ncbi:MAG TPA: VanW family protein [Candidatus Limnocylindria bacterium]|nr:VanW family protein [Candidatus Limnocylindria bacterium]
MTARPATARADVRSRALRDARPILGFLFVMCIAFAAATLTLAAYAGRALPNVTVAGVNVGSLDEAAIRDRLTAEVAKPWAASTVTATLDDRSWTTTNGALGIRPDLDVATAAALAFGRDGSIAERAAAWWAAIVGRADIPFSMRASGDELERWIVALASDARIVPVDGEILLGATGLTFVDPLIGRELDRQHAAAAFLGASALGDRTIALHARPVYPAVDASGYAAAAALARSVTTALDVTAEGKTVHEDPAALATLLKVERVPARDGEVAALPQGAVAPRTRYRYVVGLDEARVASWAAAVGAILDRPAKNAGWTFRADGSLAVVPGQVGVKVDRGAFVRAALEALPRSAVASRTITPAFVADVPAFTTEQAEGSLARVTRVTSFETFFPWDAARWRNISTGSAQFNNVVIGPGETFSFWKYLGPVTLDRGYALSGAIINGRSEDDVIGGGLCQVATTFFNAVARAGYEIVERGSHSYYIDRYPLGIDAAVFDPGLDMKWRNDTPFPVLIRSSWSNIAVEFELFTVPSGRVVTFGAPNQTNWRDVAPDQPADPHFPPGSKVLGRDVTVIRTVAENGTIVHRDVFFSRYAPVWGGPAAPAPAAP